MKLLGHIIRTNSNDPLKQVTFNDDNLSIKTPAYRRVGRPRKQWTINTLELAWRKIRTDDDDVEDIGTDDQKKKNIDTANAQIYPFISNAKNTNS